MKEYGPYGAQGPWAHKTKMFSLLALAGFQTTFWNFGSKKLFVSQDRFPKDIFGFWTFNS